MLRSGGKAILSRILEPTSADLAPAAAQYFLNLEFSNADHRRVEELSLAAKRGELSAKEQRELDSYLLIADFVGILQSKARRPLRRAAPAS
jgi:hypothetical protein